MVLLSAYDGRTRQRWSEVFCDVPLVMTSGGSDSGQGLGRIEEIPGDSAGTRDASIRRDRGMTCQQTPHPF
jgi:hypothetical protein